VFVVFDSVYAGIVWEDSINTDFVDFIQNMCKHRINGFILDSLSSYVKKFNGFEIKTDGSPAFKLVFEQICESVIWLAKKKYIKDTIWKKGNRFKSLEKIETKGIETSQSSIPKFCRNKLKDMIKFIISNEFNQNKLLDMLLILRNEFETTDIDNICKTERISNYYDFILNDKTAIEIGKNCKPHTKGSAVYNYLLYNTKYKNKYQLIQSGDRVKYYYTKNDEIETFSFLPGTYPIEIAKDIDFDLQFEKLILSPINNILKSMNLMELDRNLILFPSLY
jgi:hypothetical protein